MKRVPTCNVVGKKRTRRCKRPAPSRHMQQFLTRTWLPPQSSWIGAAGRRGRVVPRPSALHEVRRGPHAVHTCLAAAHCKEMTFCHLRRAGTDNIAANARLTVHQGHYMVGPEHQPRTLAKISDCDIRVTVVGEFSS